MGLTESQCPLCLQFEMADFCRDNQREYHRCQHCELVTVPPVYHLNQVAEKAEYDKHQNHPSDAGYRRFLSRAVTPLFERQSSNAVGLDFGCGPGPAISQMAAEQGFLVENYDPFYCNRPRLLESQYDFVTMTEVIEHIAEPRKILKLMDKILVKGGVLTIMTKRVQDAAAFSRWHYKNDPTHIAFYSEKTFAWIGNLMAWRLEIVDADVVFFHKD